MRYYEFTLPLETNDGKPYAESLGKFAREAMRQAGGVTIGPDQTGAWADEEGKVYFDKSRPYRVACTQKQADALLQFAYYHFPDQKALFVALIGSAEICERETYERHGFYNLSL